MKIFCSYAYTGEDIETVTKRMRLVVDTLEASGHEVYCPLFDERVMLLDEQDDVKGIFEHAFKGIAEQEIVVVINASERRSEGQLMEIGAALSSGKPVYYVQHESSIGKTYLPKLVTKTLVWSTNESLKAQLETL